MTKIKIIAILIFGISILLAFYSKHIATENEMNLMLLKTINEQKAFTQEISKNIFYIYRNKNASTKQLDELINNFVTNINNKDNIFSKISRNDIKNQSDKIIKLWNRFYLLVQKFRDANKVKGLYSSILLDKLVNDIYNENLKLVMEFDRLITIEKEYFDKTQIKSKFIYVTLFVILITLLLYLFTQLKDLLAFMQKFLNTSKKIINSSTIIGVKPIKINSEVDDVSMAQDNFNFFLQKIDKSIDYAGNSLQSSSLSLEQIENNIEDLLELIASMDDENQLDKELIKKEDILIEALDEVSASLQKLQVLKLNLQNFKK